MTRSTRKGPWLPEEDQTLLQLVHSQGPSNWVRISQHMQRRSPKQCRERFHQNLKSSLNHEPISAQEGEMIEKMVREMGRHWAEIARRLGNRSDNAVKNWWNGSMNRRKRSGQGHQLAKTQVGQRTQPIPATRPPRSTYVQPEQHFIPREPHHPAPELVTQPSIQTRHSFHSTQPLPSFPLQPSLYPLYDPRILGSGRNMQPATQRSYGPTSEPLINTVNAQQYPFPRQMPSPTSRPEYIHSTSWGPSRSAPEMPLVSPAASEMSRAPSLRQEPSLVSDNQSTYSVSPKTVPSPPPTMLAPIDTNMRPWVEQPSSLSSSINPPTTAAAYPRPGNEHRQERSQTDEGYVSAILKSAVAEPRYYANLPQPHVDYTTAQSRMVRMHSPHTLSMPLPNFAHHHDGGQTSPELSPASARARMQVASILA